MAKDVRLSLLQAREIMMFGTRDDFAGLYDSEVYDYKGKLVFKRTDRLETDYPYITATPQAPLNFGQLYRDTGRVVQEHVEGEHFKMEARSINLAQYEEFAFSIEGANLGTTVLMDVSKEATGSLKGARPKNTLINDQGFKLFGRKTDGTVNLVVTGNFSSYTTDSKTIAVHEYDASGWSQDYTASRTIREVLTGNSEYVLSGTMPILETNTKVFKNDTCARHYLETGDEEGSLEDDDIDVQDRDKYTLYYECDIYHSLLPSRVNKVFDEHKIFTFEITTTDEHGEEIPNWRRAVVGYVAQIDGHYNIVFSRTGVGKILSCTIDGQEVEANSFPWGDQVATWQDNDHAGLYYYWANVSTNMLIYGSRTDAENDLEKILGRDDTWDKTNYGDNVCEYNNGMSETYLLEPYQVKSLANIFNMNISTEDTEVNMYQGMYLALCMHNNPIDVCCDLFMLPIDVTSFCEVSVDTIKFDIASDPIS